jgi:hypothetical protein
MNRQSKLFSGVITVFLAMSLALAGCGTLTAEPNPAPVPAPVAAAVPVAPEAVASPAAVSAAPTASEAVADAAPEKPGTEGIKVHGHWTIEVTNPDGTLAERREFENALWGSGGTLLASLISRQVTVNTWGIILTAPSLDLSPFLLADSSPTEGYITESNYTASCPCIFKNLTVDTPSSGTNAGKAVFSGNATAQRGGQINQVKTSVLWGSGYAGTFTYTTLSSALSLTTGQQINVTVVISFS